MTITRVTPEAARDIIKTRKPLGRFYCTNTAPDKPAATAIDNRTGDAWTEDFSSSRDAIAWLNGGDFLRAPVDDNAHKRETITVRHDRGQRGLSKDAYRSTKDRNRLYLRRRQTDDTVQWCTATQQGAEWVAVRTVPDGTTMRVLNQTDNGISFEEQTYHSAWLGGGLADKKHPFSWEPER